MFCTDRSPNEFLCENNFCLRRGKNSKIIEEKWIEMGNNNDQTQNVRCNGVWDCPDGSDESSAFSGCRDVEG